MYKMDNTFNIFINNYKIALPSFTVFLNEAFCSRYLPLGIPSTNTTLDIRIIRISRLFSNSSIL